MVRTHPLDSKRDLDHVTKYTLRSPERSPKAYLKKYQKKGSVEQDRVANHKLSA